MVVVRHVDVVTVINRRRVSSEGQLHQPEAWREGSPHLLVDYGHEVVVVPGRVLAGLVVDGGDDHQLWSLLGEHRSTNAHLGKLAGCI